MRLSEEFLWGGAVAAPQLEGAWREGKKGLSIADVMTAGAHGIPRRITDGVLPGENYPNHRGIDFYHRYPQDIALLQKDYADLWEPLSELLKRLSQVVEM